jgi:hypothetical protein
MRVVDRYELARDLLKRYAAASLAERRTILDAFCVATGYNRKRAGFPPEVVEVKAVACERPSRLGLRGADLGGHDLALVVRGRDSPWTHRSWIFPRDPEFEAKAGRVLDLYARSFAGKTLHRNDYVISADEMPSIQALARFHPSLAPGPARALRVEHEYKRRGTLASMAAWDVHRAKVFASCIRCTEMPPQCELPLSTTIPLDLHRRPTGCMNVGHELRPRSTRNLRFARPHSVAARSLCGPAGRSRRGAWHNLSVNNIDRTVGFADALHSNRCRQSHALG